MPAWMSHSLKICSSVVFYALVTVTLIGSVFYTLVTGLTVVKAILVIGLFLLWVFSYVMVLQKLYRYLFGRQKDDDQ